MPCATPSETAEDGLRVRTTSRLAADRQHEQATSPVRFSIAESDVSCRRFFAQGRRCHLSSDGALSSQNLLPCRPSPVCVWACDRFAKMLVVQSECENPNNLEKSVQDFRYAFPAPADPNAIKL